MVVLATDAARLARRLSRPSPFTPPSLTTLHSPFTTLTLRISAAAQLSLPTFRPDLPSPPPQRQMLWLLTLPSAWHSSPRVSYARASPRMAAGNALIIQNKGGGHGESEPRARHAPPSHSLPLPILSSPLPLPSPSPSSLSSLAHTHATPPLPPLSRYPVSSLSTSTSTAPSPSAAPAHSLCLYRPPPTPTPSLPVPQSFNQSLHVPLSPLLLLSPPSLPPPLTHAVWSQLGTILLCSSSRRRGWA